MAVGAVTATEEIDGDYEEAVNAAVGGVVSGVSAIEGDVAAATRNAAHILVARAAESEYADTAIEDVASTAVEAALRESGRTADVDEKVIAAAALGAVEAAYQVGQTEGDAARHSVISGIFRPQAEIAPALRRQLSEIGQRMSEELPQGRAAWRGAAMFRAVRLLIRAGGIDLAAALAYFATLSFFPVVALLILGLSVLGDSEGFREKFTETLIYYFPTSSELIRGAVDALINGSLAMGLVSIISLVVGASGMISSASRTVNRVFGTEQGRAVQTTIAEMAVATLVVILFLLSVGLTVALHAVVGFGEGIIESAGGVSAVAAVALALISTTLPAFVTAGIFAVVYRRLPNVRVEWRDAAFGAIVAIILFELGKHLFFWFTNLAAHRNAIYGPLASIVILLMWTYVGGLVFLYGAALTRVAGELRPRTIAPTEEAATGSG